MTIIIIATVTPQKVFSTMQYFTIYNILYIRLDFCAIAFVIAVVFSGQSRMLSSLVHFKTLPEIRCTDLHGRSIRILFLSQSFNITMD